MATSQTQTQVAAAAIEQSLLDKVLQQTIIYTPVGSDQTVKLNPAIVRKYLAKATRQGCMPTDTDIMQFMMLCRARGLDPWIGDAFLVGYDSKDGPSFSLITSVQALLTRAEMHDQYDGLQSGVVVITKDGTNIEREGEIVFSGEQLVGAWTRVYRRDRKFATYRNINRGSYDKGRSLWQGNPAGMLVKCAVAAALRVAFPKTIGDLYTKEESSIREMADSHDTQTQPAPGASQINALTERLMQTIASRQSPAIEPSVTAPQVDVPPDPAPDDPWPKVNETPPPQDQCVEPLPGEGAVQEVLDFASSQFALCQQLGDVARTHRNLIQSYPDYQDQIDELSEYNKKRIRSSRGPRANKLFDDAPSAQTEGV